MVALFRGALFATLLAYNALSLRDMARAAAQAFLAPPGAGAPTAQDVLLPADALAKHAGLRFVADMHASPMMSARDILTRAKPRCSWRKCTRSHVDLPRLVDGHVALQFFSVFPSLPNAAAAALACPGRGGRASLAGLLCGLPRTPASNATVSGGASALSADAAPLLSLLAGAPPRTALSSAGRTEAALTRTWAATARSAGKVQVITSRDELELYVVQRFLCAGTSRGCPYTAVLLAVEGAETLEAHPAGAEEGPEAAAEALFERGVRSVSLHHARRNAAGAARSEAPDDDRGLTPWGTALLHRLEAMGVLVDLSHSSDAVIADALAAATKPLTLSHVVPAEDAAACAARGGHLGGAAPGTPVAVVSEALLARVAAAGGVVGVSFAACVLPGEGANDGALAEVAARLAALAARLGAEHVAIGSDWDGGVVLPHGLDARGLPLLTAALHAAGVAAADVEQLLGGSVLRLLRATLPSDLEMAESAARGASANRHTAAGADGIEFDIWM